VRSEPARSRPGSGLTTAGYVTLGVGAVALGAGALFGLQAKSAASDVTSAAQKGLQFDPSTESKGKRAQTLEMVCFGAGAAALITGGVLLWVAPSGNGARAELLPALGPEGAGALVSLRY
jgi:hypothetical protein